LWIITPNKLIASFCRHFGKNLSVPPHEEGPGMLSRNVGDKSPFYAASRPRKAHITEFSYTKQRHCSTYFHIISSNVSLLPHYVPIHALIFECEPLFHCRVPKTFQDKIKLMLQILLRCCFFIYHLSLSSLKFWRLPAKRINSSLRVILLGQSLFAFPYSFTHY
jgi:hypothetical protein